MEITKSQKNLNIVIVTPKFGSLGYFGICIYERRHILTMPSYHMSLHSDTQKAATTTTSSLQIRTIKQKHKQNKTNKQTKNVKAT